MFTDPVAEARERGITPYWLGSEFDAGGVKYSMSPVAELNDFAHPSLRLEYSGDIGNGYVGLRILSFEKGGSVDLHGGISTVDGVTSTQVVVGPWQAELWSVPTGTRPVNGRTLFIELADADVTISVASGSSGVPGTDVNPLLEPELLVQVVAGNLRPAPQ